MTPGEIERAIRSKIKIRRNEAQEKASYDYILANLIGKEISIILTGKGTMPKIDEVYSSLFDDVKAEQEEKIKQQKMNLSALRFKQFAHSYNNNFKSKEVPK